jgi:phage-related tail fiber protein
MIINSVMALPNGMFRVALDGGAVQDTYFNAKDDAGEALRAWEKAGNKASSYAPTIEDKREKATLDKSVFCVRLAQLGIMTSAEAISAARGDWPTSFDGALTQLGDDALEAQVSWATATDVSRNHPLILLLMGFKSITEETVDQLFGLQE